MRQPNVVYPQFGMFMLVEDPVDYKGFGSQSFFSKVIRICASDSNDVKASTAVLSQYVQDTIVEMYDVMKDELDGMPQVSCAYLADGIDTAARMMSVNFTTNFQEHLVKHQLKVIRHQIIPIVQNTNLPQDIKAKDVVHVLTKMVTHSLRNLPPPAFHARRAAIRDQPIVQGLINGDIADLIAEHTAALPVIPPQQWVTDQYISENATSFVFYASLLNRYCYNTHDAIKTDPNTILLKGFHVLPHFKLKARFISISLQSLEDIIILGRGQAVHAALVNDGPRSRNAWSAKSIAQRQRYWRRRFDFCGDQLLDLLITNPGANQLDINNNANFLWDKFKQKVAQVPDHADHLFDSLFRIHRRDRRGTGWVSPANVRGEGPKSNDLFNTLYHPSHTVKFLITTDGYSARLHYTDEGKITFLSSLISLLTYLIVYKYSD